MTRLWSAYLLGALNGFLMFALVAILAAHCAGCAHETKPAVHIPALQPPSEGVPPYTWVPMWTRPGVLCIDHHSPNGPIFDRGYWHCAYRGAEQ